MGCSDHAPRRTGPDDATVRVIAIANQKGGTGKTTTAVNLAAALGRLDRRVLLLDLDPQASASAWLAARDAGAGLLDALIADDGGSLAGLVRPTPAQGVELIPSSPQLARAERLLGQVLGGEKSLLALLRGLAPDRWDYLLIDCPPALGLLTVNALAAAGELLVPVEASLMAVAGVAGLMQTVTRARRYLNAGLAIAGIVACRVDTRTVLARDVVAALRASFPDLALETVIRDTVRLREAWGHRAPIDLYAPASHAAADYRSLALEIARQEPRHAILA